MLNGPKRKDPASRSRMLPKTLWESKAGTQSQSIAPSGAIRAPVWQLEMKRVVVDRWERRGRGGALRLTGRCGHWVIQGSRQRP